jgi:hypothetical protein
MARARKRSPTYESSGYGGSHDIRSGKWTAEEESVASKLIYAFEMGQLDDCPEGSTLRSYLAKKLNCAPMRISKKFAGQCIGKVIVKLPIFFKPSQAILSHSQHIYESRERDGTFPPMDSDWTPGELSSPRSKVTRKSSTSQQFAPHHQSVRSSTRARQTPEAFSDSGMVYNYGGVGIASDLYCHSF